MCSSQRVVVGVFFRNPAIVVQEIKSKWKPLQDMGFDIELQIIDSSTNTLKKELNGIDVLFGDLQANLAKAVVDMPKCVKWLQSTWAGIDDLMQEINPSKLHTFQPHFLLTRLGGIFGPLMADYCLGAVITLERNFKMQLVAQLNKEWLNEESTPEVFRYRELCKLTVGVLGLGDIGAEIATRFKSVGLKVLGLKRTLTEDSSRLFTQVDRLYDVKNLSTFLSSCDYICSVLPQTPDTTNLLSGDVLAACSERQPGFINVGRGTVINEDSLVKALNNGWISSAFLDVFPKEPLQPSSRLWAMKNVVITPHTSGVDVTTSRIVEIFIKNLQLFVEEKPLNYLVDWKSGY